MKRFILALALTLAFSSSVFAGDIPTSGAPAPTGPTASTSDESARRRHTLCRQVRPLERRAVGLTVSAQLPGYLE